MAKKILFTSLKGGTGVTSCAAGIAFALAEQGERTLLVDGDFNCGCALTVCGFDGMQVYTMSDYGRGACRAKQLLITNPKSSNLSLISCMGCKDARITERAVFETEGLFDYVIYDGGNVKYCDFAVIVTEPYLPSVKSADRCAGAIKDLGVNDVKLLINKVSGGLIISGEIMTPEEIAALLNLKLLAVIPEDLSLPIGKIHPSTSKAFKIAADNLCGKSDYTLNPVKRYFGVNGYIRRKMREKL